MKDVKDVLVVVDVLNDFITGSLGTKEAQKIVTPIGERVLEYQKNNKEVVYLMDFHDANYLNTQEGKFLPVEHCIIGTDGPEIVPQIKDLIKKDEQIFEKDRFGSLNFAYYVKKAYEDGAITSIEFTGVCTSICVISNFVLVKTLCPELPIYVNGELCACVTPETHEAAMTVLKCLQANFI